MRAIALGLLVCAFAACKSGPSGPGGAPVISQQELEVVEQGLTDFRLRLEGTVQSPSEARIERATYEFVVDGKIVGKGDQAMATQVPAGSEAKFQVEEGSHYITTAEELQRYSTQGGSLLVALRGTLFVRQGKNLETLPFARSRELRVPRLPTVKLHSLDGARYSGDEVNVQVSLGVVNPNPFPLSMEGLSYQLSLAGKSISEGKLGQGEKVSASSTGVFEVQVAFNKETYGPDAPKVIKTQSLPYEVKGELKGPLYDAPYALQGTLKLNVSK
jgi:LEA14-like dessication related protein